MNAKKSAFVGGVVRAHHLARRSLCLLPAPPSEPTFKDRGGAVLQHIRIMEFVAAGASHPWNKIPHAVENLVRETNSPYLMPLRQYRGAGVNVSFVGYALSPPRIDFTNPFTKAQIEEYVRGLQLSAGLGDPPNVCGDVPCLYMPTGWKWESSSHVGFHSYVEKDGVKFPYMVLTDNGNLEDLGLIFTHEFVETLTDPTGEGFRADESVCGGGHGWCEIADICSGSGYVRGAHVSAYYSNADGQCIIPSD
jgi:hypothetical protein